MLQFSPSSWMSVHRHHHEEALAGARAHSRHSKNTGSVWILILLSSSSYYITLPTPIGVGHQWTESTNIGCSQWLSLAKIALKVPPAVGIVHWWATPTCVGRVYVHIILHCFRQGTCLKWKLLIAIPCLSTYHTTPPPIYISSLLFFVFLLAPKKLIIIWQDISQYLLFLLLPHHYTKYDI